MTVVFREAWEWLCAWGRALAAIASLVGPILEVIGRVMGLVCLVLVAGELWGLWDVL